MKKYQYILIFLVCFSAFFINFFYNTNSFPIHADEYVHWAQAVDIIEKGKVDFVNPYFSYQPLQLRLENGFHLFLAVFVFIFRDNFIFLFNILKNLIFVLNTFLIFLLAYKFSKKFTVGILSSIFFILLKSDGTLYGNLFLVPLTLSISLITIFLIVFFSERKNSIYYSLILFILILITYPPASVLIFLVLFINYLINFKELKNNKKYNYVLLASSILFLITFIIILIKSSVSVSFIINNYIIFKQQWSAVDNNYSPIMFYGMFGFLLSFLGFLTLIKKNRTKEFIFVIIFSVGIIETASYYFLKFSWFIPFQRIFFYYLISLCFLSAYGTQLIIDKSKYFIKNKNILYITLTIIISIILINQFLIFNQNAKDLNSKFTKKYMLNDNQYSALKFIKENYGSKNTIIADDLVSFAVFPVTKNYVVSILESNLASGKRDKQIEFFQGNCQKKNEISKELNISLILTEKKVDCDFTNLVYSNKINVYEIK